MDKGPELRLGLVGLAAVRVMQVHALAADMKLTDDPRRKAKFDALAELVVATAAIPRKMAATSQLACLGKLAVGSKLSAEAARCIRSLSAHMTKRQKQDAMLELAASTTWQKGVRWAGNREELLGDSAAFLDSRTSTDDIHRMVRSYIRALKRLRKDSVSVGAQLTMGAVMAGAAVASGGLSSAFGTFIGTQFMGLSGAAATSAGLAFLGGGSLATGGFGMAGGALLIGQGARTAAKQGAKVAVHLAERSSGAFISELAKLDVSIELNPSTLESTLSGLKVLQIDLRNARETLRSAHSPGRGQRVATNLLRAALLPASLTRSARQIKVDLPTEEERNVAKCERAVDFEIRHLTSSAWKRSASKLTRGAGVPSLIKALD